MIILKQSHKTDSHHPNDGVKKPNKAFTHLICGGLALMILISSGCATLQKEWEEAWAEAERLEQLELAERGLAEPPKKEKSQKKTFAPTEDKTTYSYSSRTPEIPKNYYQPPTPDIRIGMSMDEVRDVWGEPVDVEIAGHPGYGNQRWKYSFGVHARWTPDGIKTLYFERGRVVGWETE